MEKAMPGVGAALNRLSRAAQRDEDYFNAQLDALDLPVIALVDGTAVEKNALAALHPALGSRMLTRLMDRAGIEAQRSDAIGAVLAALGLYLQSRVFGTGMALMPLGFVPEGFASSDYFPLLPNLGYFLLGAVLGRTVYRKKESLLPKVNDRNCVLRFLQLCGKQSLWIYLLHQPLLSGLCWLLSLLK
jgi:hypothetical protein